MNQFERARLKYEKKANQAPKVPEKKEVKEVKKEGPMVVTVSGPVSMVFEVDYAGTLMAGQATPEALKEAFKKQLAVMGRVVCR